jgi:predicted amidohydrolase YtcJ
MGKLLIKGGRVIAMTGARELRADILVESGTISAIAPDAALASRRGPSHPQGAH